MLTATHLPTNAAAACGSHTRTARPAAPGSESLTARQGPASAGSAGSLPLEAARTSTRSAAVSGWDSSSAPNAAPTIPPPTTTTSYTSVPDAAGAAHAARRKCRLVFMLRRVKNKHLQ